MNNEQSYTEQPFNLETALNHPEWVRTRDGRKIDFIKEYNSPGTTYPLTVVLKTGDHAAYSESGLYMTDKKTNHDLILRVPYRTVWVNLFKNKEAEWSDSEQGCNDGRTHDRIACVPVKIPAIC
jgi:hypothetical protein